MDFTKLKELLSKYRLTLIDTIGCELNTSFDMPEITDLTDALIEATSSTDSFREYLNSSCPPAEVLCALRNSLLKLFRFKGGEYNWPDFFCTISGIIDKALIENAHSERNKRYSVEIDPLEALVRRGCAALQCDFGACLIGKKEGEEVFLQIAHHRFTRSLIDIKESIEATAATTFPSTPTLREVLENCDIAIVHDAIMELKYEDEYTLFGLRALAFIPIHADNQTCTILVFGDMAAGYFDNKKQVVSNFAEIAKEFFLKEVLNLEKERFDRYCLNLAVNLDPAQAIKLFVAEAVEITSATVAAFYRPGSDQKDAKIMLLETEVRKTPGIQGCDLIISTEDTLINSALRQGKLVLLENLDTILETSSLIKRLHNRFKVNYALLLPIVTQTKTVGLFIALLERPLKQRLVSELQRYASQLAPVVTSAEKLRDLKRQLQRWAATFNAVSDPVVILDKKKLVVTANEAATRFFNRPTGIIQGTDSAELHPIFRETQNLIANAISSGESRQFEKVYTDRLLLLSVDPIGNTNSRYGAVCVLRDLTELRRTEATAQTQRLFFINLIENAYDAIFALDRNGDITLANAMLAELTGLPADKLIGRNFSELLTEESISQAKHAFEVASLGRAQKCELCFRHISSSHRSVILTFSPLFTSGQLSGVLVIARDVTEEKQAAAVAANSDKLHIIGQMASGIAHDFNNILTTILGKAQILKRTTEDEQLRRGLEVIETAALDGANIARRIQNFSRLNQDHYPTEVDVNEIIIDCIEMTSSRWREDALAKGISYKIETSLEQPATVLADPSELREVFVNLILNALDAMPEGGLIHIGTFCGDGFVNIALTDTGIGMTEEIKSRLFEPFFTTKGQAGTGLGLFVSQNIITRLNGRIEVQSCPGEGTTFIITLPYHHKSDSSYSEDTTSLPMEPPRKVKVLVVDDEDSVREVLSDALEMQGHSVIQASSGREALEVLSKTQFDVVFTDLVLVDMDGWKFASEVKQRYSSSKVVLVTGCDTEINHNNRKLVDMVFLKPFRIEAVHNTMKQLLSQPS
ncbi:MAG: PAS domain-containing protein [Acidobacteriota bacterium]|nr:PAS domain-containing protein [Blastocatellia bacterium]MDW8412481.1 PAS domain-containing protein [Acidobacteriota bacterium]